MEEKIYTIPVTEAFEKKDGCPFCRLRNDLENTERDLIMGASMMEPDIRIKTNALGFCRRHYKKMFDLNNRLSLALMLESHLKEQSDKVAVCKKTLFGKDVNAKSIDNMKSLAGSCYICDRVNEKYAKMVYTAVLLWQKQTEFRTLTAEQPLHVTTGLADTLMVSSVGEAAVSGVSLVDSFNTLMIQVMSALATGGAVVTSQYIGHREPKNAKAAAAQILFVLASFSLVVAAVVVVGRHAILRGIFGSIDADVMRYAETYFLLSALSYPFIGLYNAGAALFRAQGNSKISMLSSLVMNVINIGGNAVLIYGFGMGVLGAALASLVSRAVSCLVVLWLLQRPACPLRVDGLRALAPDGGLIRRILRVGIPAGIENGMFQIGKLSVSSLTSTLGTAAIAANAVANTTTTFLNIPANAVGMAALTVVGQCLGAGEKEQAVYYSRRLLLTAYCGAWVMNLSAFLFANRFAISLFNLSPEAQTMALQVMVWFNFVSLFFWPSSFTLPNILRAAGDARFTMAVSILSMWVFRVGFCYVMVLGFHGRLLSIWMGMFLDWVFRSLCFFVRFARGRWMEQSVI